MGTSKSSEGPGPGVSLVPPWADRVEDGDVETDGPSDDLPEEQPADSPNEPSTPLAPPARFRGARRSIRAFGNSGDTQDLRRALRHYVSAGYGGSGSMTRRLGSTATTAGRLNGFLQAPAVSDFTAIRDAVVASGNDVNVVLDAIVEATAPLDGTQDREVSRRAIHDALTDLLKRYPDADLLALGDAQREFVVERYAALDVYSRFCLDLQKSLMEKAPDATTGLSRLRQVREFINERVAAAFRTIKATRSAATVSNITRLTSQALRETFSIFEDFTA